MKKRLLGIFGLSCLIVCSLWSSKSLSNVMDHLPDYAIEKTGRSLFTDLLPNANDLHIFKYKPDYWKNECELFLPSFLARFAPQAATKFVDGYFPMTSASNYSPVYIYMADMDGRE